MSVRLIAGRAGSGKTHHCLAQICAELSRSRIDGPRLVFIVPEQAGLQMERSLLSMLSPPSLGRCDVISFRRLAHRILNETSGPSPVPLSAYGRQMALRHLISVNRRRLREFGKVADRTGFLAAAARGIVELLQEEVTPEQLAEAGARAESENDSSAPRLLDMAVLYRAYLEYLGSQRVDPESVLDLARGRLAQLAWPDGARIWIDGFAGLTRQQIRMVQALAQRAGSVEISLLLDPAVLPAKNAATSDEFSLFARTERTWKGLARDLLGAGVLIDEPLCLAPSHPPRFARAADLAQLERSLFRSISPAPLSTKAPSESGDASAVHLILSPDRRAEVESAVTAIVDLVQAPNGPMRYRDIAVVVRDLTNYHDLISAALSARNIPFFIDRRRPTIHHPLVLLVRGLLAMHGDAAFDHCVAMMMKSGLSGLDDAACDALENYALAHGMNAPSLWADRWGFPPNPSRPESTRTPHGQADLAAINESREFIMTLLGDWAPLPAPSSTPDADSARPVHSLRAWVTNLVRVMERMGVRITLERWCEQASARGDLDEAEEHQQVWSDIAKLFTEAEESLADEPMTGRQFREVIEAGLADFSVGLVPATLDQVLVSSIERSRHPPLRAIFVLGFAEGEFPARFSEDAIFTDDHRLFLEGAGITIGQTRTRRLLDERMLAYIACTRASEFVWVSCPQADEAGKPVTPSPYWHDLKAALPGVSVRDDSTWLLRGENWPADAAAVSSAGTLAGGVARNMREWCEGKSRQQGALDAWAALYEWTRQHAPLRPAVQRALGALRTPEEAHLNNAALEALWPPPHRISVTALEQMAKCPFRHFAGYGLRLEPRAIHEISSIDMGRMYHTVLEQFVNELNESGRTLRDTSPGEIAANLSRLCHQVVPKYAEELRMDEGRRRGVMKRSQRELPTASFGLKRSLEKSALVPIATEKPFGQQEPGALPALRLKLSGGQVVEVRGKIDRIDLAQTETGTMAVVFDYKRTIGKTLRLEEVYHGLALQLLAYLLVLREHGNLLTGTKIEPGGAFFVPLLGGYERVDHPSESEDPSFNALRPFRPRGVIDFDWIAQLDSSDKTGWTDGFSVYRTKEGAAGMVNSSDAVPRGIMTLLLDHVSGRMTSLAERWLSGDIAVSPISLGTYSPCTTCHFRSVCRIEHAAMFKSRRDRKSRTDVINELAGGRPAPSADAGDPGESNE